MDQKMMRLVGEVSGGKCKQYSLFIIKGFFVVEPEENSAVYSARLTALFPGLPR